MRFAFILAERACWPVAVMCAVLQVSASGFYAWLRSVPSARAQKDERLKVLIGESFARSRQTYGSPRVPTNRHGRSGARSGAIARASDHHGAARCTRQRVAASGSVRNSDSRVSCRPRRRTSSVESRLGATPGPIRARRHNVIVRKSDILSAYRTSRKRKVCALMRSAMSRSPDAQIASSRAPIRMRIIAP